MPRYFTVEEANQLLPQVIPLLETLRERKQRLDALEEQQTRYSERVRGNGHGIHKQTVDNLQVQIRDLVDELNEDLRRVHALGIEVKDIDMGLIDFPSLREGQEIYLCWHLGEERIAYWHDIDSGFAGRQPL